MRRLPFLTFSVAILIVASVAIRVLAQNTPGGDPSQGGGGAGGGAGGGPPPGGFHLLPRFVVDRLNLTDDQQQQIDQLEKDTKVKLAKILTAEQMKTVESARPPRRGGGGQDGQQGGPGGGGPGGPGDGGQGGGPGGGGPGGDQGPPN